MSIASPAAARFAPLVLAALLSACAPAAPSAPVPAGVSLDAAAATVTGEELRRHIAYLASDSLRGRDTPSPGLEAAAAYIAREFHRLGLRPAGDSASYVQRYPHRRLTLAPGSASLAWDAAGEPPTLVYARDFLLFPSYPGSVSGAPAFAGALSQVYERMPAGLEGRIAVVLMDAPPVPALIVAPRSAAAAGATGLLLVAPPQATAEMIAQISVQAEAGAAGYPPIPTFLVRRDHAEALFDAAGLDLAALVSAGTPARALALPNTHLHMNASVGEARTLVPNVIAVLPSSDPVLRDEYVLLSAHFDHVGVGAPDATGDSIYNGADDDASGTAVVLEVAEAFAALRTPPRRSVVFLLVSGEEKGLLGSLWFADNPTIPIERVVANINMDMVGRGAPDTLVAIGQEFTTLGPLSHAISAANDDVALTIIADPDPAEQAFFRSDHVAFVRKDIPAIFFSTWLHDDYHRPSDEVEKIDGPKIGRVGRLVFRLAHAVADTPEPPSWVPGGLEQVREILKRSPF